MARIKKASAHRSTDSRNLADHVTGETSIVEKSVLDAPVRDVAWIVKQAEVHSETNLEQDTGTGTPVIVRSFDFKANPESFRLHTPTRQELFNAHFGQIESMLIMDGYKIFEEVSPKVMLSKDKTGYRIVVGAVPRMGWGLPFTPKTLTQVAHASKDSK